MLRIPFDRFRPRFDPCGGTQPKRPEWLYLLAIVFAAYGVFPTCANAQYYSGNPLPITLTTGSLAPGQTITVTWTITNNQTKTLTGTIGLSLNNTSLNSVGTVNVNSILPGKSLTGKYTFLPTPGWSTFSAKMLYTHNETVPVVGTGRPLTQLGQNSSQKK